MNVFSNRSLSNLGTATIVLRDAAHEVLKLKDHSVIKGHRNQREQDEAFDRGFSKLRWPHGKHNDLPSRAIDVRTYPEPEPDLIVEQFAEYVGDSDNPMLQTVLRMLREQPLREEQLYLLGMYKGVLHMMDQPARTGADWDRDGNVYDTGFDDFFHVEVDDE